ncbi:MAG: GerW family sporulation protein [Lachnospiraceae bacterium]
MAENNFTSVMESLLKGVNNVLSAKTVVGEATQIGDTIILPLVDVTFGLGAGATSADKKNGGGGGATGKMTPSAVLVIKDGHTRLVNIKNQDSITKILDLIPDVIDRFTESKDIDIKEEDAKDIAFPKE